MGKDIIVILTQEEANALFTAMIGKLDDFDEEIKEAGKKGNSRRVLECAKWIEIMNSAKEKLWDKGATLWCYIEEDT